MKHTHDPLCIGKRIVFFRADIRLALESYIGGIEAGGNLFLYRS